MKFKLIAVLAALTGLLTGCVATPEPTETAAPTEPTTSETAAPVTSTLNIYCFQAGKADAFLFWNEDGTLLIDKGESGFGKTVLEKLTELEIEHPDYLLITHFDKDHLGGAKNLKSRLEPYCKATAQRKARRLTKGMSPPWRTAASSR